MEKLHVVTEEFIRQKIKETTLLSDKEKNNISLCPDDKGNIFIMYKGVRGGVIFKKYPDGIVKAYHNKRDHDVMVRLDEALFGPIEPLSDELMKMLREM